MLPPHAVRMALRAAVDENCTACPAVIAALYQYDHVLPGTDDPAATLRWVPLHKSPTWRERQQVLYGELRRTLQLLRPQLQWSTDARRAARRAATAAAALDTYGIGMGDAQRMLLHIRAHQALLWLLEYVATDGAPQYAAVGATVDDVLPLAFVALPALHHLLLYETPLLHVSSTVCKDKTEALLRAAYPVPLSMLKMGRLLSAVTADCAPLAWLLLSCMVMTMLGLVPRAAHRPGLRIHLGVLLQTLYSVPAYATGHAPLFATPLPRLDGMMVAYPCRWSLHALAPTHAVAACVPLGRRPKADKKKRAAGRRGNAMMEALLSAAVLDPVGTQQLPAAMAVPAALRLWMAQHAPLLMCCLREAVLHAFGMEDTLAAFAGKLVAMEALAHIASDVCGACVRARVCAERAFATADMQRLWTQMQRHIRDGKMALTKPTASSAMQTLRAVYGSTIQGVVEGRIRQAAQQVRLDTPGPLGLDSFPTDAHVAGDEYSLTPRITAHETMQHINATLCRLQPTWSYISGWWHHLLPHKGGPRLFAVTYAAVVLSMLGPARARALLHVVATYSGQLQLQDGGRRLQLVEFDFRQLVPHDVLTQSMADALQTAFDMQGTPRRHPVTLATVIRRALGTGVDRDSAEAARAVAVASCLLVLLSLRAAVRLVRLPHLTAACQAYALLQRVLVDPTHINAATGGILLCPRCLQVASRLVRKQPNLEVAAAVGVDEALLDVSGTAPALPPRYLCNRCIKLARAKNRFRDDGDVPRPDTCYAGISLRHMTPALVYVPLVGCMLHLSGVAITLCTQCCTACEVQYALLADGEVLCATCLALRRYEFPGL